MLEKSILGKMLIKPGLKLAFFHFSENSAPLSDRPPTAGGEEEPHSELDFAIILIKDQTQLEVEVPKFKKWMKPSGKVWLCHQKLSSKDRSNINTDSIYSFIQLRGYQTVSMISIDDAWSAKRMKQNSGNPS